MELDRVDAAVLQPSLKLSFGNNKKICVWYDGYVAFSEIHMAELGCSWNSDFVIVL